VLVVAENCAEVAPAATVTEDGTVSAVLERERRRVEPLLEAAVLMVTVQVLEPFEPRLVGEQERETEVLLAAKTWVIESEQRSAPIAMVRMRPKLKMRLELRRFRWDESVCIHVALPMSRLWLPRHRSPRREENSPTSLIAGQGQNRPWRVPSTVTDVTKVVD